MTFSLAALNALPPGEADYYLTRIQARQEQGVWSKQRYWGISSDALVDYAFGLRGEPTPGDYPVDPDDLAACQRAYNLAPPRLQALMAPWMTRYREAVEERYPAAGARVAHYLATGEDLPYYGPAPEPVRVGVR